MKGEIQEFKKGTICYRCGIDRKYARKYKFTACSSWGKSYKKHLWNTESFKCLVQIVSSNPFK